MKHPNQRLLAALTVGFAGTAHAAGFALIEQNASGLGSAYAGAAAVADNASTIFFNPAGMSLLSKKQIVVAGHLIKPSAEFSNSGSAAAPAQLLGGNGGDAGEWAFVPNFYYVHPIDTRLALGIGINAPFGLKTEYDPAWLGRFLAVTSELQTINLNPSLSYRVNDGFSVGLGINVQRIDAKLTNMINYGALLLSPGLQGLATVKGDDYGWGYNLGALFDLGQTRIGLAYRSEIDYTLKGKISFADVPAALAGNLAFQSGPVEADATLPATVSLSLFHKLNPTLNILADLTWTGWNSFDKLVIDRPAPLPDPTTIENWEDTMRYSLGMSYAMNDRWTLRAGAAFDETPVPNRYRTPRIPDEDRTWLALGGQYRMSSRSAVDFGYAHLFVRDADMTNSLNNTAAGAGTMRGDYDNSVDILSIQYTHTF